MNMFSIATAVATFAIHDFTPDFWRFWDAAQDQPVEQQVQLWQQLNVAPHQAVFDDLATPCNDQWNADWSRANFFPDLPRVVPLGMAQQVDEKRAEVAADFLRKFESTAEKDAALYINSPEHTDAVVPPRAGYRLGMLVVRELSKQHSIQTLAHWSRAEAKPQVLAALQRISKMKSM